MNNLNENINRLKKLMNINEYSKVVDTYDSVDFKDGIVGNSRPSEDSINPTLLKDINTAAKKAGVKVSVTTAVSGHVSLPSRHPSGNAVDIAIINGKAVSNSNRDDADKFVRALVDMGYTKNKEIGVKKAVLTFGFPKHDNHVHVSNTTDSPSEETETKTGEPFDLSKLSNINFGDISKLFSKSKYFDKGEVSSFFEKLLGLSESRYGNFGNSTKEHIYDLIIPKSNNTTIKSPISGVIDYGINDVEAVTIKHEVDGDVRYLEFTNIDNVKVSKGDKVTVGKELGEPKDDVKVSLYNKKKEKLNLNKPLVNKKEPESEKKVEKKVVKKENKTKVEKKEKVKSTVKPKSKKFFPKRTKSNRSRYYSNSADAILDLPSSLLKTFKNKKVNEEIEKIKKLLK